MSIYPVFSDLRSSAKSAFHAARHQAQLAQLVARLMRRWEPLADFNDLPNIQSNGHTYKGLQSVPLEQIAGSVNRKGDFDQQFRPLRKHLGERWANVYLLLQNDGWEPVRLYRVGEKYYVEDGHHRVSVAHTVGMQYIEAEVWEYVAGKPTCCCEIVRIPARRTSVPACYEESASA